MLLQARAASCFSSKFVLKRDGRPVGKYEGRWFSESQDVYLTERRRLEFRKVGWLGSHFLLVDPDEEEPLGECRRSGLLTSSWDVDLSTGPGQLVREGWFASGFVLQQGDRVLGRVDRLGWCERGWQAEGGRPLREEDLLLIGLVYHTICQRENDQSAAGGTAGS